MYSCGYKLNTSTGRTEKKAYEQGGYSVELTNKIVVYVNTAEFCAEVTWMRDGEQHAIRSFLV